MKDAFGIEFENGAPSNTPTSAKTSKMLTKKEWAYRVSVIEGWHADKNTEDLTDEQIRFRRNNHSGYDFVKRFYVEHNHDGQPTLKSFIVPNSSNEWLQNQRRVAHQELVFDILYKAHTNGHPKARNLFNKLKYTWSNVNFPLCHLFVSLCPTCVIDKPKVKPVIGAAKPIESFQFRDRMQADLVDFRTAPALLYPEDPDSPIVRWLIVVKDHLSRLVYLRAISAKSAHQVARELDHYFSFVGYPIIFQSDNGGEFKSEVLRILKEMNPSMYTLRGRARTPRDQGSVEVANKWIKIVIAASVFWKRDQLPESDVEGRKRINWATELGTAMRTINGSHSNGAGQVAPYDVVFGMRYDEPLICDEFLDVETIDEVPTADAVHGKLNKDLVSKLESLGEITKDQLSADMNQCSGDDDANDSFPKKFNKLLSDSNLKQSCSNAFGFSTDGQNFDEVVRRLGSRSNHENSDTSPQIKDDQMDSKPSALPVTSDKREDSSTGERSTRSAIISGNYKRRKLSIGISKSDGPGNIFSGMVESTDHAKLPPNSVADEIGFPGHLSGSDSPRHSSNVD
jgi:hypothetical protein